MYYCVSERWKHDYNIFFFIYDSEKRLVVLIAEEAQAEVVEFYDISLLYGVLENQLLRRDNKQDWVHVLISRINICGIVPVHIYWVGSGHNGRNHTAINYILYMAIMCVFYKFSVNGEGFIS